MRAYSLLRWGAVVLSSAVLFLFTGCSREPIPDAYGIYIRDGQTLTRLEPSMPEEKRRNFSPTASILVFDKRVASPASLSEFTELSVRRFIRFEVVQEHDPQDKHVRGYMIRPSPVSFAGFGGWLPSDVIPRKGQSEIVEIKPKSPLANGLYQYNFGGTSFPFGVGIGDTTESKSSLSLPVDAYSDAYPGANGGFSWDDWLQKSVSAGGEPPKKYDDASVLDGMVKDWEKEFEQGLTEGQFAKSETMARRLVGFGGHQELQGRLVEAIKKAAASLLENQPHFSAALANRALRLDPQNADARNIANAAFKKLDEWNEEQTVKRKAWEAIAYDTNTVVTRIRYISERAGEFGLPEHIGVATLFPSMITFASDTGGGTWWYANVKNTESYVQSQNASGNRRFVYYGVKVNYLDKSFSVDFHTEQERDAFAEVLTNTCAKFKETYDPNGISLGHLQLSVDGDTLVWTLSLQKTWSCAIHLPRHFASWRWNMTRGGGSDQIEVRDAGGKTYNGLDSIPTAGDSDIFFRELLNYGYAPLEMKVMATLQ